MLGWLALGWSGHAWLLCDPCLVANAALCAFAEPAACVSATCRCLEPCKRGPLLAPCSLPCSAASVYQMLLLDILLYGLLLWYLDKVCGHSACLLCLL